MASLWCSQCFAAIIWNLGTVFRPACIQFSHPHRRHYRIGLTQRPDDRTSVVDALNLPKVLGIFGSLIISPIVGLVVAGGLIFILRRYWATRKKRARIHLTPAEREKRRDEEKKSHHSGRVSP